MPAHAHPKPPQRRAKPCFLCGGPGVRMWMQRGVERRPVCVVCHFYRDNMTASGFRKKAKQIATHRACPSKLQPATPCSYETETFNKRRDSIRRSDIRHGCNPKQTMSQGELLEFVKSAGRCFYCGDCPTGIDRQELEQCYVTSNFTEFVACCFQCNRMKRSKSMSAFIAHMNKVTCKNHGRVYSCAGLREQCWGS